MYNFKCYPVLVARHFQYCVELFFKLFVTNGPLGKTKYYAFSLPCGGTFYTLNNRTFFEKYIIRCTDVVIDEISMVSKKVFLPVHQRLIVIFRVQQPFAGKSLLVCGDLYQLPPVRALSVYDNSSKLFIILYSMLQLTFGRWYML